MDIDMHVDIDTGSKGFSLKGDTGIGIDLDVDIDIDTDLDDRGLSK